MDVFDLDRTLVADYASFARSFTQIRAKDIRDQIDEIYATRRFWPEPLITINPHYERGASVEALVADGSLHPEVARVFRVDGQSITLYRHQMQSVAKATARQSFVVTTGTGSGKSLCFFIPMKRWSLKAKNARSPTPPRSHRLKLRPAALRTAAGLVGQSLCRFGERCRPTASKLLLVNRRGSRLRFVRGSRQ